MAVGDVVSADKANRPPAYKEVATRDGSTAMAQLVALGEGGVGSGNATENVSSIAYVQLNDDNLQTVHVMRPPAKASRVVIESNAIQAVRWRDDGPDPTPTTGRRLTRDRTLDYRGDLSKLKMIAEGPGAVLDMSYYG